MIANTLVALLILAQLADLWTTHQVFRFGGHEGNALMARIMEYLGELPTLWGKVILVSFAGWIIRMTAGQYSSPLI